MVEVAGNHAPTPEPEPEARLAASSRAPRLRVLDGLRLVAALSVMAYHYTARTSNAWDGDVRAVWPGVGRLTQYGYLGVNLFFLISGFVILMTAWGRTVETFAVSRVTRLFPAYWVGVGLTALLLLVLWPQGKELEAWHAFTNLTMLQSAYEVPHVDGVYWTLWTELRFYLLMGLFVLVGITRRRIVAVCALWPMLGELASRTNQDLVGTLLVHDYAPYFAAGMALYLIYRDGHSWLAWGLVAWNWCLALPLAVTNMSVQNDATDRTGSVPATLALVTLAFVVVALCGSRWTRRVQWRWLSVAGALTYPLYLVHEYWGFWVISLTHEALGKWGAVAVAAAVTLTMAWLIHRLVERPLAPRMKTALTSALASLRARDELERGTAS
jgi:peptidoglycan/LPS O-acetylase OafA/YrhL